MTSRSARVTHHGSGLVKVAIQGKDEIACPAWRLADYLGEVDQLWSDHHLQFLTSMEADGCLHGMFDALKLGGMLQVQVPDLDWVATQWLAAAWNEASLQDSHSDARRSFASFFGRQDGGNPAMSDYDPTHGDCHRSGYNAARLEFLLLRVGFVDVQISRPNPGSISATATKSMKRGERQIAPDLRNVRRDHLSRYRFAADMLRPLRPKRILDVACGIGYGSKMLADEIACNVTAVDVDQGAIDYARRYYDHPGIDFACEDARNIARLAEGCDAIVSFETIEHVDFDYQLVRSFHSILRDGGLLIASTPNEERLRFDRERFPFHVRHYTVNDFCRLLESAGFCNIVPYMQNNDAEARVEKGTTGEYTILVAEKQQKVPDHE